MRKMKKSRVSWPSDRMLCQVKLFLAEDCPAKVASHPQTLSTLKQLSEKHLASSDRPPGFEAYHCSSILKLSDISPIKWKCPPKFIFSDYWLVRAGDESIERQTEYLRISKISEDIQPHRPVISSNPSVSSGVEGESYDDSKTPMIRLIPIEDELECDLESSQEFDITVNKEAQSSTKEPNPVKVSVLGADVNLAASAVLTALMKSKEQRSMVDPDLLVKFLSDPKIVQNLISDTIHKPCEAAIPPVDTKITTRLVPQSVPTSAVDRKPLLVPLNETFTASKSFEPARVSPPWSTNGNPHVGSMSVQSCTSVAPVEPQPPNLNLQRPSLTCGVFPNSSGSKPHRTQPAFRTMSINNVLQASAGPGTGTGPGPGPGPGLGLKPGPQVGFNTTYQMNKNQSEVPVRPNQGVPVPLKNVNYFKNLIRKHGMEPMNENKLQTGIYHTKADNGNVVEAKTQKPCMYFGSTRGCKLGDSCMFLHDHSKPWQTNVAAKGQRAKRTKFATV